MASTAMNMRTFNSGSVISCSDPRVINNSKVAGNHQSRYFQPKKENISCKAIPNTGVQNRIALNNANYEQSYPIQTSFKTPEKTMSGVKHAGGKTTAGDSIPTQSRQICSTFRQPPPRKTGVIRIDARQYSESSESDLPVTAMSLPQAMNPLTNYPSTTENTNEKHGISSTYMKRNTSKTSLYAPSSICHMIATTTPPPQTTGALCDISPPPPTSSHIGGTPSPITGSPSLRRQHTGNTSSLNGTYTVAGGTATLRRTQGLGASEESTYPCSYSNTLPYQTTSRIMNQNAHDKWTGGISNTEFATTPCSGTSNDGQFNTRYVTFAPSQFADPDPAIAKKSSGEEVKKSKSDTSFRKDVSLSKYDESSKTKKCASDKKYSKIKKKNLWCLIGILLLLLLICFSILIYFINSKSVPNIPETTSTTSTSIFGVSSSTAWATKFKPTTRTKIIPTVKKMEEKKEVPKYCLTENCVQSAAMIVEKMNKSVDPCTDFYSYSCGGWLSKNFIPPDKVNYGVVSQITEKNEKLLYEALIRPNNPVALDQILMGRKAQTNISNAERKAKTFFISCMNMRRINALGTRPVLEMINEIGGWDALGTWNRSNWNLDELLYIIQGQQSISVLFEMSVQPEPGNGSKNVLRIDPDGITLPDPTFYLDEYPELNLEQAYKKLIRTVLSLLGASKPDRIVEEIYQFEKKLARIMYSLSGTNQQQWTSEDMIPISEMARLCPEIQWHWLLQQIIRKKSLSRDTKILVISKSFLGNLSILISESSTRTLHNYMIWRSVITKVYYMSTPFRRAMMELSTAILGPRESRPLWKECLREVNKHFGVATGVMYVREAFGMEKKKKVEGMVRNIKSAFRSNLHSQKDVRWMDSYTRSRAIEKLAAMRVQVGYEESLLKSPDVLDQQYMFDVDEMSYFKNVLNSIKFMINQRVDKIFTSSSDDEWSLSTQTMNAYYSPEKNQVFFPAALLQSPLFHPSFPMAINYGSIGSIIGHELTHGYDNIGGQYDKDGEMKVWWSKESSRDFATRSKCISDTYDGYSMGDLYVDGVETMVENIADIAGLKVSFKAYKQWEYTMRNTDVVKTQLPGLGLTNNQLFFVSFAQTWCMKRRSEHYRHQAPRDPHAPERFRVQGAVAQLKNFASAFNCPIESPLNPTTRCRVW